MKNKDINIDKLTGEQYQQLEQALASAFPSKEKLRRMVRFGLDEKLSLITGGDSLVDIIFSLIEWAESQGRLTELINAAYQQNPGSPDLKAFVESLTQATEEEAIKEIQLNASSPDINSATEELIEILTKIPALKNSDNRDILLHNLPSGPSGFINRSTAYMTDINNIINAVASWGYVEPSQELALAIVAKNAMPFVEGIQLGRDLEDWLTKYDHIISKHVNRALDAQILIILYQYYQDRPGNPKMPLNELASKLSGSQVEIIDTLYSLKEKRLVEFYLLEDAQAGLVMLISEGRKIAQQLIGI